MSDEARAVPVDLTAEQALGVALSVAEPTMEMEEAQRRAPDMLAHLRNMGYAVRAVPVDGDREPSVLRLSGQQIGSIDPPPSGDWFVDWDEYEEFVPKRMYDALLRAGVSLTGGGLQAPDGTREFVAFAVEYLRVALPEGHPTVRVGDRIVAALSGESGEPLDREAERTFVRPDVTGGKPTRQADHGAGAEEAHESAGSDDPAPRSAGEGVGAASVEGGGAFGASSHLHTVSVTDQSSVDDDRDHDHHYDPRCAPCRYLAGVAEAGVSLTGSGLDVEDEAFAVRLWKVIDDHDCTVEGRHVRAARDIPTYTEVERLDRPGNRADGLRAALSGESGELTR